MAAVGLNNMVLGAGEVLHDLGRKVREDRAVAAAGDD